MCGVGVWGGGGGAWCATVSVLLVNKQVIFCFGELALKPQPGSIGWIESGSIFTLLPNSCANLCHY